MAQSDNLFDNSKFTLNLLQETVNATEKSKNIIASPLSIQTCLALAFVGADGKTAEELSTGLQLGSLDKQKAISNFSQLFSRPDINSLVKIANKVYIQNNIKIHPEFNKTVIEKLKASAENVDFKKQEETAKLINDWVEKETNNKIQNLVEPSVLNNAAVLLVNAIYFRGQWKNPFDSYGTRKDKFWNDETNFVEVDMMYDTEYFNYGEFEDLDAKAVQLPYKDSDLYMLLIVPNKKTGLKDLEKDLKKIDISKLEAKMTSNEVSLGLPKFKSELLIKLNDILKNMGMRTMFTDAADFHHLTEEHSKIDEVFHKAVIEVDETGTEAAAASYAKAMLCCLNMDQKFLKIDRPFLYFIKDSKVSYFMGRISKF